MMKCAFLIASIAFLLGIIGVSDLYAQSSQVNRIIKENDDQFMDVVTRIPFIIFDSNNQMVGFMHQLVPYFPIYVGTRHAFLRLSRDEINYSIQRMLANNPPGQITAWQSPSIPRRDNWQFFEILDNSGNPYDVIIMANWPVGYGPTGSMREWILSVWKTHALSERIVPTPGTDYVMNRHMMGPGGHEGGYSHGTVAKHFSPYLVLSPMNDVKNPFAHSPVDNYLGSSGSLFWTAAEASQTSWSARGFVLCYWPNNGSDRLVGASYKILNSKNWHQVEPESFLTDQRKNPEFEKLFPNCRPIDRRDGGGG